MSVRAGPGGVAACSASRSRIARRSRSAAGIAASFKAASRSLARCRPAAIGTLAESLSERLVAPVLAEASSASWASSNRPASARSSARSRSTWPRRLGSGKGAWRSFRASARSEAEFGNFKSARSARARASRYRAFRPRRSSGPATTGLNRSTAEESAEAASAGARRSRGALSASDDQLRPLAHEYTADWNSNWRRSGCSGFLVENPSSKADAADHRLRLSSGVEADPAARSSVPARSRATRSLSPIGRDGSSIAARRDSTNASTSSSTGAISTRARRSMNPPR